MTYPISVLIVPTLRPGMISRIGAEALVELLRDDRKLVGAPRPPAGLPALRGVHEVALAAAASEQYFLPVGILGPGVLLVTSYIPRPALATIGDRRKLDLAKYIGFF